MIGAASRIGTLNEKPLHIALKAWYARPAYPSEAGVGLAFSHIAVMVRASRSPIRPVVPKAQGNQKGHAQKGGVGVLPDAGVHEHGLRQRSEHGDDQEEARVVPVVPEPQRRQALHQHNCEEE